MAIAKQKQSGFVLNVKLLFSPYSVRKWLQLPFQTKIIDEDVVMLLVFNVKQLFSNCSLNTLSQFL